ncbi:MAG: DUF2723 domain-containing protein [Candidatus Marinimicrobia bacterium]|nr:DUF2723 domain-containing protein [Candidatus Neomarinimicrobiota bacterium]
MAQANQSGRSSGPTTAEGVLSPEPSSVGPDRSAFEVFDRRTGPFFRTVDWWAFWVCFLVALGVYYWTLAPTVTLEDSGELIVAADYLGVPHPPGYPIWTLAAWFFSWVFRFVTYHGQPNPAWGVNFCSAFFGALASGLLGLLVSRSGADVLHSMRRETAVLGYRKEALICWVSGFSAALLFAFSPVLWSQSTISEVYSLNAFFLMIVLVLVYRWMCRPDEDLTLYAAAFLFGLGLTNHQSLLFLMLGLMVAVAYRRADLFYDFLAVGLLALSGLLIAGALGLPAGPEATTGRAIRVTLAVLCFCAPVVILFVRGTLMRHWRQVLIVALLLILGVSFYGFMAFASEQNPPMNWGYPRTWEGFKHALTRGQYEKISPIDNLRHALANPGYFLRMNWAILFNPRDYVSVVAQFSPWLTWLVLLPFLFLRRMGHAVRGWVLTSLVCFLSMTVIFVIFQYPELNVQTLFIGRVQYIQAHAIFAIWIGYGLLLGMAWLDTVLGGSSGYAYPLAALSLLLPLFPVWRNAYDARFIKLVGACDQHRQDYGWQFGNWQLRGVEGLRSDLEYKLSPAEFERVWAAYPDPTYPPPMTTNAIFFGGTDPGRFVPTYMIYSGEVRSDVYLITQNALADNTYMNVMRDLYGDRIWIPSQFDSNEAFREYVDDVQSGRVPAGADVVLQDGRVSVQGVQGVMMINGILCRMIFERNKHLHDFYIEESYVIPWMYPYLEPHGLILKINKAPLPRLSDERIRQDREFWTWYCARMLGDPAFLRDVVSRKTFSKLRSAIAGLYAQRGLMSEAEQAFQQSIDLYPLSPEANFRLADVYIQQRKFDQAEELIAAFMERDPDNERIRAFLDQIRQMRMFEGRRLELEEIVYAQQGSLQDMFELANVYRNLGLMSQFEALTRQLIEREGMPADLYLRVGQMYAELQRYDLLVVALRRYVEQQPQDTRVLIELAAVENLLKNTDAALEALRRAIAQGGDGVRQAVRQDDRFQTLRPLPAYQALLPAPRHLSDLPQPIPGL